MSPITSYRELEVWQISMDLVEHCYALAASLPTAEQFNLGNQMRRAAVSIPANIAEGHRQTRKAYLNHLSIALGSHAELETYLDLTIRIGLLKETTAANTRILLKSAARMLYGLIHSLERP
jgi:four helix bundle protein